METIILRRGREKAVERRHPWIFSRGILTDCSELRDGQQVRVATYNGDIIGVGHFQHGSIAVRLLSLEHESIGQSFYNRRIAAAESLREQLLLGATATNTYRLIHGEGDHLPGLIVDIYDKVAVVQCHSVGMLRDLPMISTALQQSESLQLSGIYCKSKSTLPSGEGDNFEDAWLYGQEQAVIHVVENNVAFDVHIVTGQKTGFFLDQRDNRQLLGYYSKGKEVLNCFCYTGGFSLYALQAGAAQVTSVDISKPAIAQLTDFTGRQGYHNHEILAANVMHYLGDDDTKAFDIVVIDPPAFAKRINKRHNAVQAYKRLNTLAINKIKQGGLLFTFSCSQVVNTKLFYDTVVAACIECGREARILHRLSQGPDHPVNAFHNEGSYLKGLVLRID